MEYESGIVFIGPKAVNVAEVNGMKLTGMKSFLLVSRFKVYGALETVYEFQFLVVSVRNQIRDPRQFSLEWKVAFVSQFVFFKFHRNNVAQGLGIVKF